MSNLDKLKKDMNEKRKVWFAAYDAAGDAAGADAVYAATDAYAAYAAAYDAYCVAGNKYEAGLEKNDE